MKKTLLLLLAAWIFFAGTGIAAPIKSGTYAITTASTNNVQLTDLSFITVTSIGTAIDALNANGVQSGGTVEFDFADGYTETATATNSQLPGGYTIGGTGSALFSTSYTAVIFKHIGTGTNPVLTATTTASNATQDYIIRLLSADNIIFDGIDLKENAANTTTASRMEFGYYLLNGNNGCQNNSIKHCKITLNRADFLSTGVYQNNTDVTTSNSYNTFDSVTVYNAYRGIVLSGISGSPDLGCKITNCRIGDPGTGGDIGSPSSVSTTSNMALGVWVDFQDGITVRSCNISNVYYYGSGSSSGFSAGIYLTNGSGTSFISENNVTGIKSFISGSIPIGIYFAGASSGSTYIHTNFISDIGYTGNSSTSTLRAMCVALGSNGNSSGTSVGSGTGTVGFYHNSLNMYGSTYCNTAVLYVEGTTISADIKNNLIKYNSLSALGGSRTFYGLYINSGTVTSNFNMFGYTTPNITSNTWVAVRNGGTTYGALSAWAAVSPAASHDGNSVAVIPNFITATGSNLHLNLGNVYDANYQATTITTPSITTDIDTLFLNNADPLIFPLKGADQFSAVTGIVISPNQPLDSLVQRASSNQILAGMTFTVQGASSFNFTGITFNTAGVFATSAATDFGYFRLFISSTNSITGATQLGATITNAPATAGGTLAFTSGSNFPFTLLPGQTYYLFLADSVGAAAVPGRTISVTTTAFSNINFSGSPTKIGTDPVTKSGTQIVAQFFYNYANADITLTSSWHEKVSGSNFNPTDFTSANQVFVFENNTGGTMTAPWIIDGTNTRVVVGDGISNVVFEAKFPVVTKSNVVLDVADKATVKFQSSYIPTTLGSLHLGTASTPGSTVEYGDTTATVTIDTIKIAPYCNLTLSGTTTSGAKRNFPAGIVTIARAFSTGGFPGASQGQVTFNGALVTQTIPTGFNFWRLRINNTAGTTTLVGNLAVDSLLRCTTSLTATAGQVITLGTNAYVSAPVAGGGILTITGAGAALTNNNPLTTTFAAAAIATPYLYIVFGPGASYNLAATLSNTTNNYGQIPEATWDASSTINITNVTNSTNDIVAGMPSPVGFGHISFDAPALSVAGYRLFGGFQNVGTGTVGSPWVVTLQGNLSLNRTNGFTVDLGAGSATDHSIFNITGQFNQANGIYRLVNSASTTQKVTMAVTGNITLSSATQLILNGASAGGIGIINAGGNFIANAGTTVTELSSGSGARIVFNKTGTQVFTNTGASFANDINYFVNAGSITQLGTSSNLTVNTGANISLLTGGIFDIAAGNTLTVNGSITTGASNLGTVSGTATSNLILGGSGSGSIGTIYFTTGVAALNNFTLDRAGTTPSVLVAGSTGLTVSGTLTIGTVNANNTIDLGVNALAAGGSFATSMSGSSVLKTQNTSGTALPANKTWGGAVWYNSASAQTMVSGNFLILNGTNGNRTLSPTGTIGIAGTGNCFITGAGAYTIDNSTVDFNGASGQNIPAFTFENMIASNLSSVKTLTGNVAIRESLTLNDNSTTQLANFNLSLLSTAIKTARLNPVTGTATVAYGGTGLAFVQRYLPARRSWRLLAAPLNPAGATHTISQAWQEGQTNYATDTSATGGFATQITGGSVANGFDQSPSNGSSVKYFSAGSWLTPVNTNSTSVNSKEGWMVFVRGDRKNYGVITTQYKAPTVTTLRPRGQLFIGSKSITSSGLTVVGNPYASAVDFNSMTRTGPGWPANPTYYIWDPYLGGSTGQGAFVTLTWNGTNFTRSAPLTGTGTSTIDNRYIPSGAAIMVDFPAGGGTLTFNETDKNAANSTLAFRPARNQLMTTLNTVNADSSTYVSDAALLLFDNSFNDAADKNDAPKPLNFAEGFGIRRSGKILSVERKKLSPESDTIFFNLGRMQVKQYQLQLVMDQIDAPSSTAAFLEDTYLHIKTPVNMYDTSRVTFSIADAASAVADRFRLVFKRSATFNVLTALVVKNDIAINWHLPEEFNISKYDIERSTDGIHFIKVGAVQSRGNSNVPVGYDWLDINPAPGEYTYRIKSTAVNGVEAYSGVVKVKIVNANPAPYVFPNPVTDGIIHLQLNSAAAGNYKIRLLETNGQVLYKENFEHQGGNLTHLITPASFLNSSTYQLEVTNPDRQITVIGIVINKK